MTIVPQASDFHQDGLLLSSQCQVLLLTLFEVSASLPAGYVANTYKPVTHFEIELRFVLVSQLLFLNFARPNVPL
jgi:hypothetical protein